MRIQGVDDGVKSTKQQDYEEAVLNAKRQAIERAGVIIKCTTRVENLMLQKEYIGEKSKAVLLPGYQILDIGYLENRTYSIILIGKIKTVVSKGEADIDGFFGTKWGMSVSQVKEALPFLFTDPRVTINASPPGIRTHLAAMKTDRFFNCMMEESYTFRFLAGELYAVQYLELNPPILSQEKGLLDPFCNAVVLNHFNLEVDSLYKKHGSPARNEEYKKIWVLSSTAISITFGRLSDTAWFSLEYEKR